MSNVELWNVAAGSNNAVSPDGFPENMQQSGYNNSAREVMAAVRRWFDDPEWQNFNGAHAVTRLGVSTMRIAGVDLTAYYTAGRRVRVTGAGDNQGSINSSAFTAGNTDLNLTLDAGASVPVGSNQIYVNAIRSLRTAAVTSIGNIFGQIPLNTQSAALGSAAYKDTGNAAGSTVPLNTQSAALGAGAYLNGGARTYTASTGGDQTAIADNTEVVVTGLGNITIPGTPDGSKKYRISGLIQARFASTTGNQATKIRVHVGTNGNLADGVVLEIHALTTSESNSDASFAIPAFDITPAAATKLTIGYLNDDLIGTDTSSVLLGTTAGLFSYVTVEEYLH